MKISNETKVGILVFSAIVILFLGYNFIKGNDIFTSKNYYNALYKRVDGLQTSNPVYLSGYKVGKVEEIELLSATNSRFLVEFSVDKDIRIPVGTKAKIFSADLLGAKAIDIIMPEGGVTTYVEDGDTLASENELSLTESINQIVDPVKKKSVNLISNVDTLITFFNEIMEGGGKRSIKSSIESLNASIRNIENTTSQIDTMVESQQWRVTQILENARHMTRTFRDNEERFNNIMNNLSNLSDTLAAAKVGNTMKQMDEAMTQFSQTMEKINNGEGSVGKLLNDDELYNNLEKASNNLNSLVKDLNENPGRYLQFSVISIGKGDKKDKKKKKKEEE